MAGVHLDLQEKGKQLNTCLVTATDLADISVARPSRAVNKEMATLGSQGEGPLRVSTLSTLLADLFLPLHGDALAFSTAALCAD